MPEIAAKPNTDAGSGTPVGGSSGMVVAFAVKLKS
jgi:hypothetical protein